MITARDGATATLLKNGKVLVAGGGNLNDGGYDDVYSSAELYDPTTGKFTPTGSMTSARADAMATLLANGNVLIAGGSGCDDPKHCTIADLVPILASAELYDPVTGKFSRTGSMTSDREDIGASATILPDGKVLIVGDTEWADVYDPSTGKFTRTGDTTVGGYDKATLLPNGKVLVTGEGADAVTAAQLYDESSGKFTTVSLALPPGTPAVRDDQGLVIERGSPTTSTLLSDGRVLLFESGYLETYDPATGKCAGGGYVAPSGSAGLPWNSVTATLLPDGDVLFTGGINGEYVGSALLYDPSDQLARVGSMIVSRRGQTATLLPDDTVLIAGGYDKYAIHADPVASAELFKP